MQAAVVPAVCLAHFTEMIAINALLGESGHQGAAVAANKPTHPKAGRGCCYQTKC